MSKRVYRSTQQRQAWRVIPDLIQARELLFDLVRKDFRARYRAAAVGFLWAVLEPLLLTLILTFVFFFAFPNRAPGSGGTGQPPFALMVLSGLVFWQYFAGALNRSVNSLVDCANLINRVYFPREIVPMASVCFALIDFAVALMLLLVVCLAFGWAWSWSLLWLPLLAFIEFQLVLGLGLLCACGNVYFRDVQFLTGVVLTLGFYASPVFYPAEWVSANLPAWAARCYMLNPMAALITAGRQVVLESRAPEVWCIAWPALVAAVTLCVACVVFRRCSPTFSDRL